MCVLSPKNLLEIWTNEDMWWNEEEKKNNYMNEEMLCGVACRVQMSWYMYIRETKISRHNVTGESACGDIDDENVVVHNL